MTLMKTLVILFAVLVVSCSGPQCELEPYPNYLIEDEDWIVYEGTLPSSYGPEVTVELSLFPGAPGYESRYNLIESYQNTPSPQEYGGWIRSTGRYIVLSSPDGQIIHITDRNFVESVSLKGEFPRPTFDTEDLYLKSDGDHRLIFVDERMKEGTPPYVLTRRSSQLFTVEGYFSVYNDTSEYFEKNTRKDWSVARLAAYDEAVMKYRTLAKEKFEGVYLKALAYAVRHSTSDGKEIDALVFKDILEMDSTADFR